MMKSKYASFTAFVLSLLLCAMCLPFTASASQSISVRMPSVQVKTTGSPSTIREDFNVLLMPDDASCPMPIGSENGEYIMSVLSGEIMPLPSIEYTSVGEYNYKICQLKGRDRTATYDDTVYYMKVYITNSRTSDALYSEVVLSNPNIDGKPERLDFINSYPEPTKPSTVPAGQSTTKLPLNVENINAPHTGDDPRLWIYIGVSAVSFAMLLILTITAFKNNDDKNDNEEKYYF